MHRSHQHQFKYSAIERNKWQNPVTLLNHLGLSTNMCLVDIGCNDGYFTIPAARIVGVGGKIYAIDIDQEALNNLNKKLIEFKIKNVDPINARGEDAIPCHQQADRVFVGMSLHDFDDPLQVLINAKEMLKISGAIYNLDWKKEKITNLGPPADIRLSIEQVTVLAHQAGLKVEHIEDIDQNFYLISLVI